MTTSFEAAGPALAADRRIRTEIVREVAIGGLAGLVAGVLAYGIGGRIFMRIAALIDPAANGLFTSNDNRIGAITAGGTVAFVLAIGLFFGVVAGIHWVVVRPWLPGGVLARATANAAVMGSISPVFIVRADELDFRILHPAVAIVAMLVGLAALAGFLVATVDDKLRRGLPAAISDVSGQPRAQYLILSGIGVLFLPVAIGTYFTTESTTFRPPTTIGLALVVVGLATVVTWALRVREPGIAPRPVLTATARGALFLAVGLGIQRVVAETSAIISAKP